MKEVTKNNIVFLRYFGGTYHPHHQGEKNQQAMKNVSSHDTTSIDPQPQTSPADCRFSSPTATFDDSRNSLPNLNKACISYENRVTDADIMKNENTTHSRSEVVTGSSCLINGAGSDQRDTTNNCMSV
jgi:hypothetical protein